MYRHTATTIITLLMSLGIAGCCIEDGEGCLENSDCCSGCCTNDTACFAYSPWNGNVCVSDEEASASAHARPINLCQRQAGLRSQKSP